MKKKRNKDELSQMRRQEIINAGFKLFQASSYEAVNIINVTQAVGIAKGTFYLYFKSKEELFLAIISDLFEKWFDEMDELAILLKQDKKELTVDDFIAFCDLSIDNHPEFFRLLTILHTVLEHNIGHDTATGFKEMLLERTVRSGENLESFWPFLKPGEGASFILRMYAVAIGIKHIADPAPIIKQVIDENNMALFDVDFKKTYLDTLRNLIVGMKPRET